MDVDPVEYVVIEFPGNRFDGSIAPAIVDLVDRGLVRILDLVFVKKDADGTVLSFEYDELEETADFAVIDGDADGLLSDGDVGELAAGLAPNSSALFVLFEDRWASALGKAVRAAGGELVDGGRLPHAAVVEALELTGASNGGGAS
jgi:uncharacterized membrane protein